MGQFSGTLLNWITSLQSYDLAVYNFTILAQNSVFKPLK